MTRLRARNQLRVRLMATARMRARRGEGEASAMVTWRDARTMVIRGKQMKEKRATRAKDQTEEDQSNGVSVGDYLQMRTR